MVKIDLASAGIDVVAGQATPTASTKNTTSGLATIIHLTRGFDLSLAKMGTAFDFLGHVNVTLGPRDSLEGFKFGFVQFIRDNFTGVFYAGRNRREGSINILLHPEVTQAYFLDVLQSGSRPFALAPTKPISGGEVGAKMGDHPFWSVGQQEHNHQTGVNNFLFHIVDDRDAWSIFTVQDNSGKFQHLAHVHWFCRWDITFQWRGGTIQIVRNQSSFRVEPVSKGRPIEPALRPLLDSLGPALSPLANEKTGAALKAVLVHPNPNRSDNPTHFVNVPRDFFA